MKKFILKIVNYVIPVAFVIISLNISIDPANIVTGIESEIAEYLCEGKNVTGVGIFNLNERSLQKHIISNLEVNPTTLVLGSSRVMLIGENLLGEGTRNSGVKGASLEDLIAIYQLYAKNNISFKKIIIGVDPWFFNEYNEKDAWETLKTEYYSFFENKKSSLTMTTLKEYFQLIMPSYFQASLKLIPRLLSDDNVSYKPTNKTANVTFTRLADGSITYDEKYRAANLRIINERVREYINSPNLYALKSFNSISDDLFTNFKKFIRKLQSKNIDIELVLLPYHPDVYNYIQQNPEYFNVINCEKKIVTFAENNNIPIAGSYNPDMLDFEPSYFYDGMHLKPKGVKKVLNIE